ncbi:Clp protease N-terminal domain-containing protein [Nonomuraea sp. NPDC050783]|uniref:Clp protease N-terminal domain-containing protein n=1 Tax=Nonomuraea sp. NPDC050783 TaxID=3154634 RepID=UPI003467716D
MFGREKSPFGVIIKAAAEEARQRGDRRMGTEHLLVGLLHHEPCAQALGVDAAAARAALEELDRESLRMLGLEVGDDLPARRPRRHPPIGGGSLTSNARAVVGHAVKHTTLRTRDKVGPALVALALLDRKRPDPVAQLIDRLGIDRPAVRARLA